MNITDFENLIQQQPGYLRDYPKFNEWLKGVSDLSEDTQQIVIDVINAMAINNATGDLLNKLGELVGIKRNQIILDSGLLIDDVGYRKVIKGKISQNYWDGSFEGFVEVLNTVFEGTLEFSLIDNQDMSATVLVAGLENDQDLELLTKGYYTPKAMGVNLVYNLSEFSDEEFTFVEELVEIRQITNAFPQNNNPIVENVVLINGEFYSG